MGRGAADGRGDEAWTAGALVFSGRPDPGWRLDAATAARVVAALDALPELERAPRAPRTRKRLGYRGCFLAAPDGTRWTAHAGVVVEERASGAPATRVVRRDDGRAFERLVLATAPPGTLPPGIADDEP
jgi:hypothetical protein